MTEYRAAFRLVGGSIDACAPLSRRSSRSVRIGRLE